MHQISMAIRQLSHRSMVNRGSGFAAGMNNGLAMGMGMGMRGGAAGLRNGRGQGMNMNQAQSDAVMSRALRTLQGIGMQLSAQGVNMGHARASGHVQMAIRELNTALSIR
jgi:hypothetical protein